MKKWIPFILIFFALTNVYGHTINYTLDKMSDGNVFLTYLQLGFMHIIPLGFDHILFITCVFFLNTNIKKILIQASMFTLAHSITLGLAMYGIIKPPTSIVEPLIAISIVFLALENIYFTDIKPWRLVMVFLFGLVHGMGFASSLSSMGLPDYAFVNALISFNIGVELGQIAIIMALYFLISRQFSSHVWYRSRIVIPISLIIVIVAGYWTIERIFFI